VPNETTICETGARLFPKRALWLKDQLQKRKWNKSDVDRRRGPDPKTIQNISDGFPVRQDTDTEAMRDQEILRFDEAHAVVKLRSIRGHGFRIRMGLIPRCHTHFRG
jgi:hypothetical protein